MDGLSALFVLLLLCSASASELSDNEIAEQRLAAGAESENAVEPEEPLPLDVRAVLRDVSSRLAENTLRIQQLETLNQEQAQSLVKYEARVKQLETLNEAGKVAFSTELKSGNGYVGPFPYLSVLIFRKVITNIGNAYNPYTGIFFAPVRGAYHFDISIDVGGEHDGAAMLFVNADVSVQLREAQATGWGIASKGATLILNPGDNVYVRLASNFEVHDLSTFSGRLLFPM